MLSSARVRTALLAVLALVGSLLLLVAPSGSAEAATGSGTVRGAIYGRSGTPTVVMQWFTADWKYLGKRKVRNGVYSLRLQPGTYRLQFVDQRPAYDLTKYAPADATVQVRAGHTTQRSVRMRKGAAIYGVVRAGGRPAAGARVVAANTYQQSYEATSNRSGEYAIGGLPTGRYSVFTFDRKKRYVAKSSYVGLQLGRARKVSPSLRTRAGRLLVDLYAGSAPLTGRHPITVVSRSNGQWWTANASGGSVSFAGLYPGRYKIIVPGVGNYFASTGTVAGAEVRPGRAAFGSYRLTKRGGWVTGTVVDSSYPTRKLSGATVTLRDAKGATVATTTSGAGGRFTFGGPLTTRSGMKVVVGPGPYSPYLGTDPATCAYISTTLTKSFTITTGREAGLGLVGIDLKPGQGRPECVTAAS
jgi:Carboxypeptidase regulatory-like domain